MARKKPEQRLIFIASKTTDGRLKIDMQFYPPLAKSKEEFETLPMEVREMQNAMAAVGRFSMEKLAQEIK